VLVRNGEGSMDMWQRLLERFVPLMDEDVSSLDRRDGVGASSGSVPDLPRGVGAPAAPAGRTRTAYEGRISPLTS
jgi:hypothetical protein